MLRSELEFQKSVLEVGDTMTIDPMRVGCTPPSSDAEPADEPVDAVAYYREDSGLGVMVAADTDAARRAVLGARDAGRTIEVEITRFEQWSVDV